MKSLGEQLSPVSACGNASSDSAHLLAPLEPKDFQNPSRSAARSAPPVRVQIALAFRPVVCGIYVCRIHYIHSPQEKKIIMDLFHRRSLGKDTPTGRDCQFCHHVDPDFTKRDPMDRL